MRYNTIVLPAGGYLYIYPIFSFSYLQYRMLVYGHVLLFSMAGNNPRSTEHMVSFDSLVWNMTAMSIPPFTLIKCSRISYLIINIKTGHFYFPYCKRKEFQPTSFHKLNIKYQIDEYNFSVAFLDYIIYRSVVILSNVIKSNFQLLCLF